MSRRPPPGQRTRGTAPPPGSRRPAPAARPPARYYRQPPPQNRDRTPLIVGGIVIALLVLLVGVYIVTSSNPGTSTPSNGAVPTVPAVSGAATVPATGSDPPRISLEAFKALYDDPTKRPLILDVRDAGTYAAGHIVGAESFPEADVDARYQELPKDKLIVAYCQ